VIANCRFPIGDWQLVVGDFRFEISEQGAGRVKVPIRGTTDCRFAIVDLRLR